MTRESIYFAKIEELVKTAEQQGASDLHLIPGRPPLLRIDGELVMMPAETIEQSGIDELLSGLLTEAQTEELRREGDIDFAYTAADRYRIRVNAFRQNRSYAMSVRLLSAEIPQPESLGIPDAVTKLTGKKSGLLLVAGAAGSGKTTTLASLIDNVSANHTKTIVTLEHPIEYLYPERKAVILQREIGSDSISYVRGLDAAMRQDTDLILAGELRSMEAVSMALEAAGTGHLVLAVVRANGATEAIEQLTGMFPLERQQQMRTKLSETLLGVVAQQLVPQQKFGGMTAAFEVLLTNPAVRGMIREGKTNQLMTAMQDGGREGMQTMDDALYDLYMKSSISSDTAISCSAFPEEMKKKVQLY